MAKDNKNEESDKLLVDRVLSMYKKAYTQKEEKHKEWDACFKSYSGEADGKANTGYMSQQLSNYVFSTVETIKPIMLAENPKIVALPREADHYEKSDLVKQAIDYEWDRTKMFQKLHSALTVGLITGTFIISLVWDGGANKGQGEIKPLVLNPFNCFVDPMATSVEDAEFVIYAAYKNVGEIIQFAPEKEEELRLAVASPSDEWLSYGQEQSDMESDTTILYIEAYFRDYSTVIEEIEEDGAKKSVTKRKYPNGRRVILAGDVKISDGENPYEDGKFPFVVWRCYEEIGEFWGFGEVKNIVSPQKYSAMLTNHVLDSARLMSNPVWIIDKNAGIKKNSLTNREGLVIRKNPGSEVTRASPPAMPSYVQNIIDMLKRDIEHVSGVFDVTRGERPTGITAAAAIQALTEQAQGRIKLKIQALEAVLADLGAMWVSRMRQFWVTSRTIRMIQDDYSADFLDIGQDDVDGDWDIIISAGSTMAVNKTARLQQMISLAQTPAEDGLPMIDRQTMLESSDLPDVKAILTRFEEIKEQQRMDMQNQQMEQLALQDAQQQLQLEQQGQMVEQGTPPEMPIGAESNMPSEESMAQAEQIMAMNEQRAGINQEQMGEEAPSEEAMIEAERMLSEQEAELGIEMPGTEGEEQPDEEELEAMLMQVMEVINSTDPEELAKLAEENPDVLQILQLIAQLEQPEEGLEGGELE